MVDGTGGVVNLLIDNISVSRHGNTKSHIIINTGGYNCHKVRNPSANYKYIYFVQCIIDFHWEINDATVLNISNFSCHQVMRDSDSSIAKNNEQKAKRYL